MQDTSLCRKTTFRNSNIFSFRQQGDSEFPRKVYLYNLGIKHIRIQKQAIKFIKQQHQQAIDDHRVPLDGQYTFEYYSGKNNEKIATMHEKGEAKRNLVYLEI